MRHPAARWVVLALAVAIAAGLVYHATVLEQRGLDDQRGLAAATADARALQTALSEARRALAAMSSPGQPAVSWSRQAGAAIDSARMHLTSLAARPGGAGLAQSGERLDRLVEAEGRLHEYAVGGRSLQASDVAFGEALPHLDAIDTSVAEAVAHMTATADTDMAATRRQQALALAGALGTLTLAALVLTPTPRRATLPGAAEPVTTDERANDLSLHAATATQAVVSGGRVSAPLTVNLMPVAAVCQDLAQLSDVAALAAALERVAPAIGAKGIVVWLVDADRRTLQVAASWGYDARVVARFPAVPVSDDNPTARAFAAATPSTAAGRTGQPAAVATPIIGSNGAVGVLALELTSAATPSTEVVAVAGIVAAQLATLLEPLPRGETPAGDVVRAQG
ncbi:MAG: GAF domain-containing protein [Acidobacteriota bacterium]